MDSNGRGEGADDETSDKTSTWSLDSHSSPRFPTSPRPPPPNLSTSHRRTTSNNAIETQKNLSFAFSLKNETSWNPNPRISIMAVQAQQDVMEMRSLPNSPPRESFDEKGEDDRLNVNSMRDSGLLSSELSSPPCSSRDEDKSRQKKGLLRKIGSQQDKSLEKKVLFMAGTDDTVPPSSIRYVALPEGTDTRRLRKPATTRVSARKRLDSLESKAPRSQEAEDAFYSISVPRRALRSSTLPARPDEKLMSLREQYLAGAYAAPSTVVQPTAPEKLIPVPSQEKSPSGGSSSASHYSSSQSSQIPASKMQSNPPVFIPKLPLQLIMDVRVEEEVRVRQYRNGMVKKKNGSAEDEDDREDGEEEEEDEEFVITIRIPGVHLPVYVPEVERRRSMTSLSNGRSRFPFDWKNAEKRLLSPTNKETTKSPPAPPFSPSRSSVLRQTKCQESILPLIGDQFISTASSSLWLKKTFHLSQKEESYDASRDSNVMRMRYLQRHVFTVPYGDPLFHTVLVERRKKQQRRKQSCFFYFSRDFPRPGKENTTTNDNEARGENPAFKYAQNLLVKAVQEGEKFFIERNWIERGIVHKLPGKSLFNIPSPLFYNFSPPVTPSIPPSPILSPPAISSSPLLSPLILSSPFLLATHRVYFGQFYANGTRTVLIKAYARHNGTLQILTNWNLNTQRIHWDVQVLEDPSNLIKYLQRDSLYTITGDGVPFVSNLSHTLSSFLSDYREKENGELGGPRETKHETNAEEGVSGPGDGKREFRPLRENIRVSKGEVLLAISLRVEGLLKREHSPKERRDFSHWEDDGLHLSLREGERRIPLPSLSRESPLLSLPSSHDALEEQLLTHSTLPPIGCQLQLSFEPLATPPRGEERKESPGRTRRAKSPHVLFLDCASDLLCLEESSPSPPLSSATSLSAATITLSLSFSETLLRVLILFHPDSSLPLESSHIGVLLERFFSSSEGEGARDSERRLKRVIEVRPFSPSLLSDQPSPHFLYKVSFRACPLDEVTLQSLLFHPLSSPSSSPWLSFPQVLLDWGRLLKKSLSRSISLSGNYAKIHSSFSKEALLSPTLANQHLISTLNHRSHHSQSHLYEKEEGGEERRGDEKRGEEKRGEERRGEEKRGEERRGEEKRGEERKERRRYVKSDIDWLMTRIIGSKDVL